MTSVGEQLQQARQRAGLSVPELSARTKIAVRTLEAIERDDFSRLPGGIYTRGFLSACSREVHLDPDAILADYAAAYAPHLQPPPVSAEPADGRSLSFGSLAAWLQALTAAVILAFLYLLTATPSDPRREETGSTATTGGEPAGAEAAAVATTLVAYPEEQGSPEGTFRIEIRPAGLVWVEATADGQTALYQLMDAGEQVTITARNEMTIRVGDAAAFRYFIDGRPGRSLGGPGQVREVRLTRDHVREFMETGQGSSQP